MGLISTPSSIQGADEEWSFYIHDNNWMGVPGEMVRYSIRKDGFISLHAGSVPETIVTKSFTFEGNELNIAFNSKYLMDVIHNISTERISMCFNTSLSPCVVKPEEGKEYLFLVLPVRIYGK